MKGLKAFRKICKNLNSYEFTDEFKKNKKLIEKHLKALEIIKNKAVIFIDMLKDSKELKEYNDYVISCLQLTEEEWKSLKEVLNNGN